MEEKKSGIIWLIISVIALFYPLTFNICNVDFFNKHQQYTPSRVQEFSDTYPFFGNPISATYISALFLICSLISSIVALKKIEGRKAYFIALPVAIISGLLFLLTLFSLM